MMMGALFFLTAFFATFFCASTSFAAPLPEIRRAIPVASEASSQAAAGATQNIPSSSTSSDESTDIRIAPINSSDPQKLAAAQLGVADGFFNRKEFLNAAAEYEKFLQMTSPGQPYRDQALFRLGECRRKLGSTFASADIYQQLLKEISSGMFAAGAAYRLGEYYQSQQENQKAMTSFAQAASLCDDPKIKNAARYQQALCCDQLGEEKKSTELLQEVAQEENPNRVAARMTLAHHEEKTGDAEKALTLYQAIAKENSGAIAAEAFVKAGMIAYHLEKKEEATQFFNQAASLINTGDWEGIAALALMKMAYEKKEYSQVLAKSEQATLHNNADGKTQALFLTAQAHRQLGHFKEALSFYDQVISEAPLSDSARDALFIRLLVLQSLNDPTLLAQLEKFLQTTTDAHQHAQAQLLKAETLFQSGNYASAAAAYDELPATDLSSELKLDALYKEAWAWNQAGDFKKALPLLSTWMAAAPQSPQLPAALIQRASLEQKINDPAAALADYSNLIAHYPKAPERELALQQKALLHGQQQDNKEMVETFQQLLQSYPQSAAAAQANFWIGWASFEKKDYVAAIPFLEKARALDSKQFGERTTLRLVLAHYYLQQFQETLQEASNLPTASIPLAVAQWIGAKAYEQGKLAQAEKWLMLVAKSNQTEFITQENELMLAHLFFQQGKFQEALAPANKALELSHDPASRAEATLTLASIQKGLKKYPQAVALAQEALLLQPEGTINMKARFLLADLLFTQQDYDNAARAYRAIALLAQDKAMAAQALHQAAEAYQRANNPTEAAQVEKERQLLK